MQRDLAQAINWELAALQRILPNSKLPAGPVRDSKDLQLVQDAAAVDLSSASSATQAEVKVHMKKMRQLLAHKLIAVRRPWQGLTSSKPHWLDRIAHMEKVLTTKAHNSATAASSGMHKASLSDSLPVFDCGRALLLMTAMAADFVPQASVLHMPEHREVNRVRYSAFASAFSPGISAQ